MCILLNNSIHLTNWALLHLINTFNQMQVPVLDD